MYILYQETSRQMFLQGSLVNVPGKKWKKKRNLECFAMLRISCLQYTGQEMCIFNNVCSMLHVGNFYLQFSQVSLSSHIHLHLLWMFSVLVCWALCLCLGHSTWETQRYAWIKGPFLSTPGFFHFQVKTLITASKLVNTSYGLVVKAWIVIPGAAHRILSLHSTKNGLWLGDSFPRMDGWLNYSRPPWSRRAS